MAEWRPTDDEMSYMKKRREEHLRALEKNILDEVQTTRLFCIQDMKRAYVDVGTMPAPRSCVARLGHELIVRNLHATGRLPDTTLGYAGRDLEGNRVIEVHINKL